VWETPVCTRQVSDCGCCVSVVVPDEQPATIASAIATAMRRANGNDWSMQFPRYFVVEETVGGVRLIAGGPVDESADAAPIRGERPELSMLPIGSTVVLKLGTAPYRDRNIGQSALEIARW